MVRHRVVVVEDDPDAADLACGWFRREGHDACVIERGGEAVERARAFAADVALVDIGLPDTSGFEVARSLRRSFGAKLYIAAITGWARGEIAVKAFAAGCDHYILKPAGGNRFRFMMWDVDARSLRSTEPMHVS